MRVHGVDGLRVVDAASMRYITNGNIYAPVMMLAEKAADLVGVVAFSVGTQAGLVSIVLVASAVFPLIAVGLSVAYLGERPVPNQYVGVGLVAAGLILLGLA